MNRNKYPADYLVIRNPPDFTYPKCSNHTTDDWNTEPYRVNAKMSAIRVDARVTGLEQKRKYI